MNVNKKLLTLLASLTLLSACQQTNSSKEITTNSTGAPLASWNEGQLKSRIIDYVTTTTDKNSASFVPVEDRIAVFDNDGTMWSEQPFYFQYYFALHLLNKYADKHPEWKNDKDLNLLLKEGDKAFLKVGHKGLAKLLFATNTGQSVAAYKEDAKKWAATAIHPTKGKRFPELAYQPMLELLAYLKANEFKNYIVSGGTSEFMRAFICELYQIDEENILGSYFKGKYHYNNGKAFIERKPEFLTYNDKGAKVELIQQHIGKKPIFAGGNSDGDLAMLQWSSSNKYKNFQLYIHHTDAKREWAYDRKSPIGELNLGLDEATKKGWGLMDMKKDWKVIYK
ncbi:MAG: haloacid dehalogenase-like hydrolase [Lentisphaeria bacterium]|nr:haloacid dehalogenase-like hydrolase [Lentisphaeria bacterium]